MKTNRILSFSFLVLTSVILIGLFITIDDIQARLLISFSIVLSILLIARSYRVENYLRLKDSLKPVDLTSHIGGLLNDKNKAIAFAVFIRPILTKDEFVKERRTINILTFILYFVILIALIFYAKSEN